MFKIFVGLIMFVGFLYVGSMMVDPDLGWHLKVGEEILTNRSVPHFDDYSWTMSGFEWIDHEWPVDAWLAYMYSHNLWWVVVLVVTFFATIPFFVWIWRSHNLAQVWMVILAAISEIPFIGVRPQTISFLLFFVVFELLRKEKLVVLPIIFLIWANLHAGFFAGLVLFGLFIFGNILKRSNANLDPRLREDDRESSGDDGRGGRNDRSIIVFIVSIAVTIINPYGWKLYKEIFTVIFSSETMRYIAEWQPIFSKIDFSIMLFMAIILAMIWHFYRKYDKHLLFIVLLFITMAVKSARNWPLFLIVSMPVVSLGMDFVKNEIMAARNKRPVDKKTRKIFIFFSIAAFIFIIGFLGYRLYNYESMKFPEKASVFLSDKIKSGQWQDVKLLNTYGWGGYLINNAPNAKVFIDGRMPHWVDKNGNSAMKDYIKIFYSKNSDDREEVFARRGIEVVLIENKSSAPPEKSFLEDNLPDYFKKIKQFLRSKKSIIRVNEILNGKSAKNLKEALSANGWIIEYEDEIAVILRRQ